MALDTEATAPLRLPLMAKRLGVPSSWLRAEADAGRVPHLRAGGAYLFDARTVERIVGARARGETAPSSPSTTASDPRATEAQETADGA